MARLSARRRGAASQGGAPALPTRNDLLAFITEHPEAANKRDIACAFRVKGADRPALKALLRDLEAEGALGPGTRIPKSAQGHTRALPEIAVLEIVARDEDGEAWAQPVNWEGRGARPRILVGAFPSGQPAPGIGGRFLARVERQGRGRYRASPMRTLERAPARIVGVFEALGSGGRIRPVDRRIRDLFAVPIGATGDAENDDIVLAELAPMGRVGQRQARVVERLGRFGEPSAISLVAIHAHGIPVDFPPPALAEAAASTPPILGDRVDLRAVPLVTIDGADARDFDDAVFAEPDQDAGNPGGWHLLVAIADVASYVAGGGALDCAAEERGNSVYFPDRVVPMLPEALSNGLCSLRPDEDRACLAVHIWIDAAGRKLSHRFVRGLMRSKARLTYERAQDILDRSRGTDHPPLLGEEADLLTILRPLQGAYGALATAREQRGAIDLDLPERQIRLNEAGQVAEIRPRKRLDSHRLIEEFMILANVCAAETLEQRATLCMYRVHDEPSREKLEALRDFLGTLDLSLPRGQALKPKHFMRLIEQVRDSPHERLVNEVVLRSQSQAVYSPENLGHFGLALARYAHFTSPIRRYSDLLVHRGLIAALKLGEDGLARDLTLERFAAIGEHISQTERRADLAAREAAERYIAAYLEDRVGAVFAGRISGVARFGCFVTLSETGADGLVPMRALPNDYYHFDEPGRRLVGERHGRVYRVGDAVEARLVEVDVVTGSLLLALEDPEEGDGDRPSTLRGREPRGRGMPARSPKPPKRSTKAKPKASASSGRGRRRRG